MIAVYLYYWYFSMLSSGTVSVANVQLKSAAINPDFLEAVSQLPQNLNISAYLSFIATWGTHYISEATFGGRVTISSSMSLQTRSSLVTKGVNIEAGVSTLFRASLGVATSTELESSSYTQVSQKGKLYIYTCVLKSINCSQGWVSTHLPLVELQGRSTTGALGSTLSPATLCPSALSCRDIWTSFPIQPLEVTWNLLWGSM